MKKVIFNSVKIKNFLSIGEDQIEIDFKTGITIITGENKDKGGKNGIGKSTISDAIFWCLFGNTIRELKKDKIQHNKNDGTCQVSLSFTIEDGKKNVSYTIKRILDPAKIEIIAHNDEKDVDMTLSTIPKNDEYIKQLIGANEEVFNNAVIMSANNTMPFMAQKKTEKRKFIEGILQMNIFSEMLLKARSLHNDSKKENDLLAKDFVNEQRILEILKSNKENFDENKNTRIGSINEKIKNINIELENLRKTEYPNENDTKKELERLREIEKKIDDLQKDTNRKISDLTGKKSAARTLLTEKEKEKAKFNSKTGSCPTCKRNFSFDSINHITEEIKKLDKEIWNLKDIEYEADKQIKENSSLCSKIYQNKTKIQKLIDEQNSFIRKSSLHEEKLLNLINKNIEYEKDIKNIENELFKDDQNILNSEQKIKDIETKLISIKKELQILDTVKFIVSEEGVKAFIVKKIMDIFNNRLNFYLKHLDAPCKCIFDESFEETIYNEQGKECSYFNFSGGERKRIDTAILFTFQDVLRLHSGTSFSLNIYDELFDSALDDKGIDKILEILKTKVEKYQESVYIITHKNNTKTNIDNILFLEKENGVTRIIK